MPGRAAVVDASALAAILFGEPAGPEMVKRLEDRALLAPTLLRYELASVCVRKGREAPEKEKDLLLAFSLLSRLGIEEIQVPPEALVEVARKSGLTAYDAAYLWLARAMDVELVSLDARLNAAQAGEA
jgi:predicted nucleic acid-binding protein